MSKLKSVYFINPVRFHAATLVKSGPRTDLHAEELLGAIVTDRFLEVLMLNGDMLCVPLWNVSALMYGEVSDQTLDQSEKKPVKRGRPLKA